MFLVLFNININVLFNGDSSVGLSTAECGTLLFGCRTKRKSVNGGGGRCRFINALSDRSRHTQRNATQRYSANRPDRDVVKTFVSDGRPGPDIHSSHSPPAASIFTAAVTDSAPISAPTSRLLNTDVRTPGGVGGGGGGGRWSFSACLSVMNNSVSPPLARRLTGGNRGQTSYKRKGQCVVMSHFCSGAAK